MKSKFTSRLKVGLAAAAVIILITSQSCDDDTTATCTGCTSANPWSKPNAGSCYATLTACTNALGSGCVICN